MARVRRGTNDSSDESLYSDSRPKHSVVVQRDRQVELTSESEETGEYDENYNLVSVLYHALQGAETYAKYIKDAERVGDNELADFFEEIRDDEVERAARAKKLLIERLLDEEEAEDTDEEDLPDDE